MFTFVFIDVRDEQLFHLLIKTIVNLKQKLITMYMYFQNVYLYFSNNTIFGQDSHGFQYNIS